MCRGLAPWRADPQLVVVEHHFSHLPERILYRTMLSDSTFVQLRRLNIMKSQRNFD